VASAPHRAAGQSHALRRGMQLSLQRLLTATVSALVAAACGGAVTEQVVGPGTVRCQIGVSSPPAVPATGSSVTLNIDAARDCTWTASSDTSWVQVTPASGQGSGTLTVAVTANPDTRARSGAVLVNDTSVRISQDATPCRFDVDPRNEQVDATGGRTAIRVVTTDACEWRASSEANWLRVVTERGTGTGRVELEVSRNDGPARSTALSIAGLRVDVLQDSPSGPATPPAPPPPPPNCTFAIDADRASFRSIGGAGSVRVITEPGCPWTASAQPSWLSIPQASGSGPGAVAYVVAAHTSTVSDRSGTMTVAGRTHTVSQQACPVTVDPGSQAFPSQGGGGAVRVNTEPGCTWSASSGADWISISRSSGAGTDSLQYQVGVYTSTATDRAGAITVAGRTHEVRQAAYRAEEISREGILSDVSGSCPNFTFVMVGRVFITDQRTKFDTECEKVRTGAKAFVRGTVLPDGRVLVSQLDIDD
jgi:hypothetical protein